MAEAKAVVGVSRDEMQVDMEYFLSCHLTVGNYPIQPLTLEDLYIAAPIFLPAEAIDSSALGGSAARLLACAFGMTMT